MLGYWCALLNHEHAIYNLLYMLEPPSVSANHECLVFLSKELKTRVLHNILLGITPNIKIVHSVMMKKVYAQNRCNVFVLGRCTLYFMTKTSDL